jgi:hypothetical protein
VQLLERVFAEQFELVAGKAALLPKEKESVVGGSEVAPEAVIQAKDAVVEPSAPESKSTPSEAVASEGAGADSQAEFSAEVLAGVVQVQPKGKGQLSSDRVQNPHDPEATYAVKGQGEQKKEHVGYRVQVAETVTEAVLAPGEPTRNFLVGIVTHPAYQSDEVGEEKMEKEQAQMGLEKPPVKYVDGAYVSGQKLAQAQAEGRELMGPAQPAPKKDGRFSVEDFEMRHRNAIEGTQSELVRGHLPVPGTADRRNAAGPLSWFGKSQATKLFYWSGVQCEAVDLAEGMGNQTSGIGGCG